jgi:hypothetical protein
MDRKIYNIVRQVLSEDSDKMCSECGGKIMEGECMECGSKMMEDDCSECGTMETEFKESKKLSKGQEYIAKQAEPKNKIDAKDFAKLRAKKSEKNLKENLTYKIVLDESTNETFYFKENEVIDIIENIVNEEKSKKTKVNNVTKDSQSKSKKENDDYINSVVKKMKDYLKGGSKGEYETEPKHFPKGNGELEKMDKMAYIPSDAVGEYIENFTAAGLENLDYDEIHPNEKWVEDNLVGSSRTGNNPEWANAVETEVGEKRNKIRKDNLLAKMKRKAYNKSPQPVLTDKSGSETDKASKLMMKLESTDGKIVLEEIQKMKNLIDYGKKTQ